MGGWVPWHVVRGERGHCTPHDWSGVKRKGEASRGRGDSLTLRLEEVELPGKVH